MDKKIRLQKALAQAGVASRRKAEELIAAGKVKVNGQVVREQGVQVDPARDLIQVEGRLLEKEKKVYFVLYKPPEVVTTLSDPQGRDTVAKFFAGVKERVFAVGRLDYDAEGALIVTNDGDLANKLMHPRYQVPRVYMAKVKGCPDEASLEHARRGVRLDDGFVKPVEVEAGATAERNTWVKIVLTEGRPHLVKRFFAAIGYPVVRLYRPFYGGVSAVGLRPGELRALTPAEITLLMNGGKTAIPKIADIKAPPRRHRASEDQQNAGETCREGVQYTDEMEEDLRASSEHHRGARGGFVSAPKEASKSVGNRHGGSRREPPEKKESRTWKVVNSHAQERLLASAKLKDRERSLAVESDRFFGTAKTAAGAAVRGKTAEQKPQQQGKAFGFGLLQLSPVYFDSQI